jgi:hypothetical protein
MKIDSPGVWRSRHFVSVPVRDGELLDLSDDVHPTRAYGWGHEGSTLALPVEVTHFCFVLRGPAQFTLRWPEGPYSITLLTGMYLSAPGPLTIEGGTGMVVSRLGYRGVFLVGGPIEPEGRLRYIDGCSDSLLVPPVIRGDPCLNHLHFPTRTAQTRHTHPSIRVGVVTSGYGRCVVPDERNPDEDVTIPLRPGHLFLIPVGGEHSFFTDDSEMDVIAYHPDSDTGPDHDDHPMVNRTIVGGVPASQIAEIRTR